MKSFLLTTVLILCSSHAAADSILGLYFGLGQWQGEVKGETGEKESATTLDDLGFDKNNNNMFWVNLEHPVPVLPNIRIMHTDISSSADSIISQEFSLGTIVFEADVRTLSELVLSHTDVTFYYEILDNWVEADLGVTARVFDGYVKAESEITAPTESTLAGSLPMLYGNAQINLPFSGWHIGATANVIRYRGDGFHDYSGRIGYFYDSMVMDFGLNLGFREMSLDVAEFDDLYVDASVSGVYLEALIHF